MQAECYKSATRFYALLLFPEEQDAGIASGGNLLLVGAGIMPKMKTGLALWGVMAGLDNKAAGTTALPPHSP